VSFIESRDLQFLLYDWLKVEGLTRYPRYADHSRETFDAVLDLSAKLAMDQFASHYKKADRIEPVLEDGRVKVIPEIKQALRAYADAGLFAASFDNELGGLQLPHAVEAASMAHFFAANVGTAAYPMLTCANARVLSRFGTESQIATFAQPQIEGRWLGTMCLSEPQAGSSLADITTRASYESESELGARYRLVGNKMWISGGDHDLTDNIVHLVLAKIPDADGKLIPGTGGITLFIVPKILLEADGALSQPNDIGVAGLNHKMGYRATTNCLLNFGEGMQHRPDGVAGAVGYRVGAAGQGLAIMFHMMNEARISVGLGAASLAYRGYRQSLDYARDRPQGRPPTPAGRDPASPQRPIIEHADVKRMLLTEKAYAEGALALTLYCAHLVDQELVGSDARRQAEISGLLGLLTPVAKSWPSEFGLVANDLAIQIHGGYGYTRDFDVEQLYRDNRLNPIHEGTYGIQALDLLGRKILRDKTGALASLALRVNDTVTLASTYEELRTFSLSLAANWQAVCDLTDALRKLSDPVPALDNASAFLSAFGHVVVAWLWLDQAVAILSSGAAHSDDPYLVGKIRACRFFFDVELPKVKAQLALVGSLTDVAASMPEAAF
jgi:alkylation response protein AidB-like acyl-CoA dehydrogenase